MFFNDNYLVENKPTSIKLFHINHYEFNFICIDKILINQSSLNKLHKNDLIKNVAKRQQYYWIPISFFQ